MNWVLRRLAGAFLAGVGWKLGSEAYEYVKRRVEKASEKKQEPTAAEEAGPATTETAGGQGPR